MLGVPQMQYSSQVINFDFKNATNYYVVWHAIVQ